MENAFNGQIQFERQKIYERRKSTGEKRPTWNNRNIDIPTKLKAIDYANFTNNTLAAQKFHVTEGSIKYWRL